MPLWYFNHGRVFAGVVLTTLPLLYLLARCAWIGVTNRGPGGGNVLPVWALVLATFFLVGFRVELNHGRSGVIDVGYAGVIGADLIGHGQDPYGRFPVRDTGKPCGPEANMAKLRASEAASKACDRAVQTLGGYGLANDFDIERYYRDIRLMRIAPVSTEMVLNYLSEHVLGLPRSY